MKDEQPVLTTSHLKNDTVGPVLAVGRRKSRPLSGSPEFQRFLKFGPWPRIRPGAAVPNHMDIFPA